MAPWHVYVVRCRDDSLYIGITNDLDRRLLAHNAGRGGAYTRSRRPVALAFSQVCPSPTFARRLEVVLKRLDRRRRLRLVAGDAELLAAALAAVARLQGKATKKKATKATTTKKKKQQQKKKTKTKTKKKTSDGRAAPAAQAGGGRGR